MKRKNLLFAVLTAFFLLAAPNLRAESSGNCGINVTWTLDDQGVLTISGEGAMDISGYSVWNTPSVTSVVIEDGVTTICDEVFYGCGGMKSVIIPNSVTSIGDEAFMGCESLTSVTIPNSVTSIGDMAFFQCTGLESVTIGSSVTSMGSYAFVRCSALKKIECLAETPPACDYTIFLEMDQSTCVLYVPEKSIQAYKDADGWKDFTTVEALQAKVVASGKCGANLTWTLDDQGVLTISGEGAMYGYSRFGSDVPWKGKSFTKAVIKDGVTTVGTWAFYECTGLTSVEFPNSLTKIQEYAFYKCNGLASVEFPNSLTNIGQFVFMDCTGLKSVTFSASVTNIDYSAFFNCSGLEKIECLAEAPPVCGGYVFYNVDKSTCELYVPKSAIDAYNGADGWKDFTTVEALPSQVVASGDCGTNVTWSLDSDGVLTIAGEGAMTDYKYDTPSPWKNLSVKKAVIGNGVTKIGEYAFQECTTLTSVDITGPVTSIGWCAFDGCEGLTSVTIPNSVTSIEGYAFYECEGLTSITIPSSVTNIGENAFTGCIGITSVSVETENSTYDSRDNCNAIIETKTNTLIAGFKNTTIPNSVTSIGKNAFNECYELTSVTIPSSVTSIGDGAFGGCMGLTSVTIPASVTSIGGGAFAYCSKLEKIECLAEVPPTCGADVFYNVDKSTCELYVPKKSSEAYKDADGWKDFTKVEALPSQVVASGDCGNGVTWTLDDQGVLTFEGTGAIPDYAVGSAPWSSLSFTSAVIGEGITTIGELAFAKCTGLTSVTIPNSVTSIGGGAFFATGLTSVEIPNSVTSIGDETFADCTGLTSVTLSNSLTDIAPLLFYECTGLTSVEIPNSVTSIGESAFSGCTGLKSVTIPNSVTSIGKTAFAYCSGLTSVEIPASVTSIERAAFGLCTGLTSVTILASVENIETQMFYGCAGLTSVEIPASVTSIGRAAFALCTGLTSVTIPASVEIIGEDAFAECTGLKKIESLAETPPACDEDAFSGVDKNSCELYVPEKSIKAYNDAEVWKDFFNIAAGISGVAQDNNVGVSASNGTITVTGAAAGTVVEVYNANGTQVYRGTGNTVNVPSAGMYIVRAAGKTVKVNAAR